MTKLKKEKKEDKQDEIVPLRCYACKKYDGFGPKSDEFTHVCEDCKQIPTDQGPIIEHIQEYNANLGNYGEETLPCERCKEERDTCLCPDNPLIRERLKEQGFEQEVQKEIDILELEDEVDDDEPQEAPRVRDPLIEQARQRLAQQVRRDPRPAAEREAERRRALNNIRYAVQNLDPPPPPEQRINFNYQELRRNPFNR